MVDKELKKAISLVFKDGDKILTVRRSQSKSSFPNCWSLPSTFIHEGETVSDAATRLAMKKLNLENISLEESIGISDSADRGDFILVMEDFLVGSYEGAITLGPDEYTELRWVTAKELMLLIETDNQGAIGECTRTFLKSEGLI